MKKFWIGYALGSFFTIAGSILGVVIIQPDCPTEDSCKPSYSNGEWKIVEVTP